MSVKIIVIQIMKHLFFLFLELIAITKLLSTIWYLRCPKFVGKKKYTYFIKCYKRPDTELKKKSFKKTIKLK